MFTRLLSALLGSKVKRTGSASRQPITRRTILSLEELESRVLPSTVDIDVTRTGDDANQGSLRWAINTANSFGIGADGKQDYAAIHFTGNTFAGDAMKTITLLSSLPTLKYVLSIEGTGANKLTIARNQLPVNGEFQFFRILTIESNRPFTISGVTIKYGFANNQGSGGGINYWGPNLIINSCIITENVAKWNGGGVSCNAGLQVFDSTISKNLADGSGGGINAAGRGNVTIEKSVIKDNMAGDRVADANGKLVNTGDGGGIFIDDSVPKLSDRAIYNQQFREWVIPAKVDAIVRIEETEIDDNTAYRNGGGIAIVGSTTRTARLDVQIKKTTLASNKAVAGAGGGIWTNLKSVSPSEGPVLLQLTVHNNKAAVGGLGIHADGSISITESTVTNNLRVASSETPDVTDNIRPPEKGDWAGIYVAKNFAVHFSGVVAAGSSGSDINTGVNTFYTPLGNFFGIASWATEVHVGNTSWGTKNNPLDPKLGQLANNGGPTRTQLPLNGSPLIDAAGTSTQATDQRGLTRTVGPKTDIGAVEVQAKKPKGKLSDDKNGDGMKQDDEAGLSGITIQLLDSQSNVVAETVSGDGGEYGFDNVAAGTYRLKVVLPAGSALTLQNQGSDDTIDSDFDPFTQMSDWFTLNDPNLTFDGGIVLGTAITGRVWQDYNADGVRGSDEPGIDSQKVYLLNDQGQIVATTQTNEDGFYGFANLPAGAYSIALDNEYGLWGTMTAANVGSDDTADSDADPATATIGGVTVAPGETVRNLDFGMYQLVDVSGRVWLDANANGEQQSAEPGIEGVTVRLLDSSGQIMAETTSGWNGNYTFTGLLPGEYAVEVVLPEGYAFTDPNQADDAVDSDVDPLTARTATRSFGAPAAYATLDAGLTLNSSTAGAIIGKVWFDENADGLQGVDEPMLDGITVRLLDEMGMVVATTSTTGGGGFAFTNLTPGTYRLEFVAPLGYAITIADQGTDDTLDSDADPLTGQTGPITVSAAQVQTTTAAGLVDARTDVSGRVWDDVDADGIQDPEEAGIQNVMLTLYDDQGEALDIAITDQNGAYSFTGVLPGSYRIGILTPADKRLTTKDVGSDDTVDSDFDLASAQSDLFNVLSRTPIQNVDAGLIPAAAVSGEVWVDNGDGIRQAEEFSREGVTVRLLDSNGIEVATTLTAEDGTYVFASIPPGTYQVEFVAPAGYTFTLADQGTDDAVDSDAVVATGRTALITLAGGQVNTTTDAGLINLPPATVSGQAWLDANGDGIREAGEAAFAGIEVRLIDATTGVTILVTTTDSNGNYSFASVPPGSYFVEFVPPTGYFFTLQDQGTDDSVDSDVNPTTNRTSMFMLDPSQNLLNVDAGLVNGTPATATVSGQAWVDANGDGVREAGEAAFAGIDVRLVDATTGMTLQVTTTDSNGNYSFASVLPGSYFVEFVPPTGYVFTLQDQGSDDSVDSDVNPTTNRTSMFMLDPSQNLLNVDAGLVNGTPATASVSGQAWVDANGDGIREAGEAAFAGIQVHLVDATTGVAIQVATTDSNGNYSFSSVPTGSYYIEVVPPIGYVFTLQDQGSDDSVDSDVNPTTNRTSMFMLGPSQNLLNVDAGLVNDIPPG